MSTNFPTALDTLTNPTPTDYLNSPSHAGQHANANDAIEAIQAKLGIDSSAVTTSHDYKLSEVTGTDKAVGKTATQTLTNKTLTSPVIGAITNTDHITITPGTSKLVKLAVLTQNNTTNAYKNNSVILTGWGFITGDGTNRRQGESISFGITFSSTPIILVSKIGNRLDSDPTNLEDLNQALLSNATSGQNYLVAGYAPSTAGFGVLLSSVIGDGTAAVVLANNVRFGYSWIAIGVLN